MKTLVDLALNDKGEFKVDPSRYGHLDTVNCTLNMPESEWKNTVRYRQRYGLLTATAFFRQALEHGCTLYTPIE